MRFFLISLFVGVSSLGTAQSTKVSTPEKVDLSTEEVQAIQKKIKDRDAMSVSFDQVVYRNLRKTTTTKAGRAFFIKPNKFRWELDNDHWIFDGEKLFIYHPSQNEAVKYNSTGPRSKELRHIVDMVLNVNSLFSNYQIKKASQEKDILSVSLIPKKSEEISQAELEIDLKLHYVRSIQLNLKGDNKTTFKFSHVKSIPKSDQILALPKTTKISEAL